MSTKKGTVGESKKKTQKKLDVEEPKKKVVKMKSAPVQEEKLEPVSKKEKEIKKEKIKPKNSTKNEFPKKTAFEKLGKYKTILISSVPNSIDKEVFFEIFSKCGSIENVTVFPTYQRTDVNDVEIEFKTKESMEIALKMDQMLLQGNPITIKQKAKKLSVHVSKLPKDVNKEDLRLYFSQCGEINRIFDVRPGTCLINFKSHSAPELAIKLSGTKFLGEIIEVVETPLVENPAKARKRNLEEGAEEPKKKEMKLKK
jgi:RNA recognition motif-containing protein